MTMTSFPRRTYMFVLAALLAIAAIVSTAHPSAAQQGSTSSTLAAPVLTARASANAVELDWEAVDGAGYYELWSQPRAGEWQRLDDGTLTGTTYSHTDVSAATTYYYLLRAVSGADEPGDWSQSVSATFAGSLVAPVLMVQTAGGAVELSWEVVAGAQGYELFVWDDASDWQQLGGGTLAGTTFSHTDLVTDKTYYYLIRAVNESEVSPWSQQVSTTVTDAQSSTSTPTPTPTQTPTTALDSTPTPTPSSTPTLDSTPTPTPSPTPTLDLTPTPTPSPTPTLDSEPTQTPTPTPTSTASTLSAPVLTAQATEGAVKLSWEAVSGAVRYELWVWTSSGGWEQLDDGTLTGTTHTHSGLTVGTTYHYAVRAVNAAGDVGGWSSYVSATVTEPQSSAATPTPTPTSTATSTASTLSTATQTPTSTTSTLSTATPTPTSTASTLSTATPTPSPTPTLTASTLSAPALTVQVTEDAVKLSWEAVSGAVRYVLWAWTSSGGRQRLDDGTLTDTTYTHTELAAGTTYHYTVLAVNAANEPGAWSPWIPATVPGEEMLTAALIFAKTSPAIAFIETEVSSGSGVLLENGYVVTAAHVVWPFDTVRVVFPDGTAFEEVAVNKLDLVADLAVLGPLDVAIEPATMIDGEDIPIGSRVYLIGYPGEYELFPQPTITGGVLSRLRQWEPGGITLMQTDSTVAGGQSGGALVSDTGAVIGMSNFKIFGEFGLVVSAADLLPRIQQLIAGQDPGGHGERRLPPPGGALRHNLTLNNYWDDQAYVIYEPPGTEIRFSLLGYNNGAVSIYDAYGFKGETFDTFEITGFEYGAYILGRLTPHYLIVRQKALSPGNFIVAANHNIVPVNDPDGGQIIQVGQSIHGNIDYPTDADHFFLDLERGQTVEILAQSIVADMFLTLSLGSPTQSVSRDDGAGLLLRDSRLLFRAPITRRYIVIVETFEPEAPGGYIVTVNAYTPN